VQPLNATPKDLVERQPGLSSGTRSLEHGEVARDAAPLRLLGDARARDVVGHQHGLARDALGAQPLLRLREVQHVTGVVAEGQQHTAAVLGGLRHRVHLLRGWGCEQVAHCGARREAAADQPAEGRVVAGAAADHHGDLTLRRAGGAHHTPGNAAHPAGICGDEAVDHLVGEGGRFVEQASHAPGSLVRFGRGDDVRRSRMRRRTLRR
jgi:hypothetical protein